MTVVWENLCSLNANCAIFEGEKYWSSAFSSLRWCISWKMSNILQGFLPTLQHIKNNKMIVCLILTLTYPQTCWRAEWTASTRRWAPSGPTTTPPGDPSAPSVSQWSTSVPLLAILSSLGHLVSRDTTRLTRTSPSTRSPSTSQTLLRTIQTVCTQRSREFSWGSLRYVRAKFLWNTRALNG